MRHVRNLVPLAVALITCACGSAPQTADQASALPTAVSLPTPSPAPVPLTPLTARDSAGELLKGELACSFVDDPGRVLLIARGDVASDAEATAIINPGDRIAALSMPGGYDAMAGGGVFRGEGVSARVVAAERAIGDGESPPRAAGLTVTQRGRAPIRVSGRWTCGP